MAQIPPPPPAAGQVGLPLPYIPEGTPGVWPGAMPQRGVEMPGMRQRSVVAALTPARPANAAFWIGLVLVILSLVLVVCPTLLAFAVAVDPEQEQSGNLLEGALGVSCCLFLGLLVPGILLLAVGRPRRL